MSTQLGKLRIHAKRRRFSLSVRYKCILTWSITNTCKIGGGGALFRGTDPIKSGRGGGGGAASKNKFKHVKYFFVTSIDETLIRIYIICK